MFNQIGMKRIPEETRDLDALAEIILLFGKATTALAHPQSPVALGQALYYAELAVAKLRALQPADNKGMVS